MSSYAYLVDDLVIVFALQRAQFVPEHFVKVFSANSPDSIMRRSSLGLNQLALALVSDT